MSLKLGTQDIAGISTHTNVNAHSLFDCKWADHKLNEISWLEASTFSWQSGDVYVTAYNHLVQDIQGITSETETIGSYTVTFYRATDGHKVALADQEQTVLNIYNTYGVAWYYILDTTNTQFKLPRTKYGFEGLRTNVGDKIDESLPNITGTINSFTNGMGSDPTGSGALIVTKNSTGWQAGTGDRMGDYTASFDASRSSSTYQDNAPVQERATQMYLYFYVGDYTQSAIEQTAGLNSELFNGKADVDLTNATDQAKILMGGMAMPSNKYIDLTLGASGSTYTAPANGYVFFVKTSGGFEYVALGAGAMTSAQAIANAGWDLHAILPVKKGQVFTVTYNATGATKFFRFVYAVGSESEAS